MTVSSKPNPDPPLILTLELASPVQEWAQHMRTQHFPPERNIVPAHVTLFHALPSDCAALLCGLLEPARPAPAITIEAPFSLGRGVAYRLICPELASIRTELAAAISIERLSKQDRAHWRPHLTVQNKVEPQEARALLVQLSDQHVPIHTDAAALRLWRYLGGPWQMLARLPFIATNTK